MIDLRGKRILFISPEFFGIDKSIMHVLEEMGAKVQWFDERSIKSSFFRAINSVCSHFFYFQSNNYYKKICGEIKDDIDIILIIKGDMISRKTIELLRRRFKNVEIILYLYDSVRNINGILNRVGLYDEVLSFDPKDCKEFGFEFRPLFCDFENKQKRKEKEVIYDICFYGTMYGDRFRIVNRVQEYCKRQGMRFFSFCYLRGKFMALYYWITEKEYRKMQKGMISFKAKSTAEIEDIVASSKIVLDANDVNQQGLTIRTLETLMSGKKMITTNKDITNYDFYNPNNILVVDRDNIQITEEFMESEYIEIDPCILTKYSAEGWVEDVFKEMRTREV